MRSSLLGLAAVALAGCDWNLIVDVDIRVEAGVQQALTSWPQQLLIHQDGIVEGSGTYRVAVLCAPSAETVVARWHYGFVNGCGDPATLTAWVEPLDPAAGLACGALPGGGEYLSAEGLPPVGVPTASAGVFQAGGRCPRHAEVELTLAIPSP